MFKSFESRHAFLVFFTSIDTSTARTSFFRGVHSEVRRFWKRGPASRLDESGWTGEGLDLVDNTSWAVLGDQRFDVIATGLECGEEEREFAPNFLALLDRSFASFWIHSEAGVGELSLPGGLPGAGVKQK